MSLSRLCEPVTIVTRPAHAAPLTDAALNAQPEAVKALLDAGAEHSTYVNQKYAAGSDVTPLDYAKEYTHPETPSKTRHPECVALLEAAGAKTGFKKLPHPMQYAIDEARQGSGASKKKSAASA
jgi:hypothetical protein